MEDAATTTVNAARPSWWFAPVLGPLLLHRPLAAMLASAGVLQVAAGLLAFRTLPCPMLYGVGIPCPGCGASRACGALLRGDWQRSIQLHALSPLFVVAVILFAVATVLPAGGRTRLARFVDAAERRSGATKLLMLLVLVYWAARLAYAPGSFIRLMRG